MPLPDFNAIKDYLRIETDKENGLLQDLAEDAKAWAELLISRPITAKQKTMRALIPVFDDTTGRGSIYLKGFPVASDPAPIVTDSNGDVVDVGDYTLDRSIGRILSNSGVYFSGYPYEVVAYVGLDADPDFADRYESNCRTLILGLASILYHKRNPSASSESDSGASISNTTDLDPEFGIPKELAGIVRRLKPRRV